MAATNRLKPRYVLIGFSLLELFAQSVASYGADWRMRGRDHSRNAVVPDAIGPIDWQTAARNGVTRNLRWSAELGSQSVGDPVISGGLVWVGTNNSQPRDRDHQEDAGALISRF
ncbi:MAG: hypothetical protein JWM11_7169 [Planctomycetaceae bacterium]|nr:hypothetical protein [Planctomycetaceae bacterium]